MLNSSAQQSARETNIPGRGWWDYLPNILLLIAAFLVSVQFQTRFLLLDPPTTLADAQPPSAFLMLLIAGVVSRLVLIHLNQRAGTATLQFAALALAIAVSALVFLVFLPQIPHTQVTFFVIAGMLIGSFTILFRARITRNRPKPDLLTSAEQVWRKRDLLILWTRNNVRARYSQAILGIIWVVLLPLSQALILAFVFSQIIRVTDADVPFVSFYLAALVPWTFISNGIVQGAICIINQIGLINQVYFPREILPLVKLGELAVDALFTFCALVILNLLVGILPNANWIYLPLLCLIIFAGTFGLALYLSILTAFVRDIPQLAFVGMQLLFYLTPIIYPIDFIPEQLRAVVMLNPLVPLIQGFREILVFDRPIDLVSLYYPAVVASILLFTGYAFFKANERRITDYV